MNRPTLAFQIEQATVGGPVNNFGSGLPAGPALEAMWASLAPLRAAGFPVCFVLNPAHRDWPRVVAVLDTLAGMGASYALDVAASDTLALDDVGDYCTPWSAALGLSIPVTRVRSLGQRHGAALVGLRFHEVFTTGWAQANTSWWDNAPDLKVEGRPFYDRQMTAPYLAWARQTGRWACWSEPTGANPAEVRSLCDGYPGTVVPTYANNVNGDSTVDHYWPDRVQPMLSPRARGWGLGLQTWRWDGTGYTTAGHDAEYLAWLTRAVPTCALVVAEPGGALWNIPVVWDAWADAHDGSPRPLLGALTGALR